MNKIIWTVSFKAFNDNKRKIVYEKFGGIYGKLQAMKLVQELTDKEFDKITITRTEIN